MLENIRQSAVDPHKFIMMSGSRYFGRLQFDQKGFCQQVCDLLKAHCGQPLAEVGGAKYSLEFHLQQAQKAIHVALPTTIEE